MVFVMLRTNVFPSTLTIGPGQTTQRTATNRRSTIVVDPPCRVRAAHRYRFRSPPLVSARTHTFPMKPTTVSKLFFLTLSPCETTANAPIACVNRIESISLIYANGTVDYEQGLFTVILSPFGVEVASTSMTQLWGWATPQCEVCVIGYVCLSSAKIEPLCGHSRTQFVGYLGHRPCY